MISIGYSERIDFNEALQNALADLRPQPAAGMHLQATVTETGYDGGTDGLPPRLYVVLTYSYRPLDDKGERWQQSLG